MERDQAGNIADAANVRIAVFLAESQPLGKMRADLVAVQERAVAAELGQAFDQGMGDGALARARKPGEPDGQSLAEPGRVGLVEDLGHGRPAEPLGKLEAAGQVLLANLGSGDVGRLGTPGTSSTGL